MKTGTVLVATLALVSFPLVAQQSAPENTPSSPPAMQPHSPAGQQSTSPAAEPERADQASAAPATAVAAPADLRAVKGELVSKIDTKTAKTGDDVVVQTKAAVKTADGTEIPKGSKLVGHVLAVQASTANQNSQVVLLLDHAELKGGQSLPIQSQIQSIGEGGGDSAASDSAAMSEPSTPSASPGANGAPGNANGGSASSSAPASPGTTATRPSTASPSATTAPAAGTVVARTGNIAIRATSIPGVLLANNEPGQRDPRMAQASSILLGAQRDVQFSSGTPVVIGVSAATK